MNFLAHLHLAHLAESSLLGNLLADFVRGNPDNLFSPEVVAGIYMHRRVDKLTDTLPEIVRARVWFRPETRRVSPISLDVMWDHFLARHWQTLSPETPLAEFVTCAQDTIEPSLAGMPSGFINLNQFLWQERWLERYRDMPFIADVLRRMAIRRPKLAALEHSAQDLLDNYSSLEQLFWEFYPQMMKLAEQKHL